MVDGKATKRFEDNNGLWTFGFDISLCFKLRNGGTFFVEPGVSYTDKVAGMSFGVGYVRKINKKT